MSMNLGKMERQYVQELKLQDLARDRSSDSSTPSQDAQDAEAGMRTADTKDIIRKMDWKILPVMSVLYLLSFLDRTNIGNAKIAGLGKDLKLKDKDYNLALTCFFVTYAIVEVPSNLMLKKVGAKIWLPVLMLLWGACCIGLGFVENFNQLLAGRLMLGLFEGGLFPGVTYYLTTWYPRSKISLRIAIFFSAATLAGAFGGLLAYGLQKLNGKDHLKGWQWIFIVEGLLTCVVAFGAYFFIPNTPAEAHWLSEHERNVMKKQIAHDGDIEVPFDDTFKWKFVLQGFLDWKLWLNLIMYIGSLMTLYSVSLSLPSIVKGLGYKTVGSAQLHTVPVYIVACVFVVGGSYLADWAGKRSPVVLGCCLLAMVGWLLMYFCNNLTVRYAGAFLAASGSYSSFPPVVAILTSNIGGKTKRATVIGLQVGIGGLSGCISSNIFRAKDAPHYKFGLKIDLIFTAACFLATAINMVLLIQSNKKKAVAIRNGTAATLTRQELAEMGDASPYFIYQW